MPNGFSGMIFDVDGVLVDSPHEVAWRESLRTLMSGEWADLAGRTSWSVDRFTPRTYQEVMSGKPRMEGARDALAHFGIPDADTRAVRYAERKQAMVVELIHDGRFRAYPDALRFVLAVRAAGMRIAAASSSKNAGLFLSRIRLDTFAAEEGFPSGAVEDGTTLLDVFDVDISGRDLIRGKPDPEIFRTAADELGIPPHACVVVEDAVSGVQAAKAARCAAIGLARHDDAALLQAEGADLVVTTLDDVDLTGLGRLELARRT
ncbi:HAD-IA family hydrolase [Pseudonocardia sp. NPDC046786]|uniref:HAD family hydrolase n=1 Tax=Pseudonocardia sp. NPDC046786 TaxID=3155471 RepID=UPI0033C053B2